MSAQSLVDLFSSVSFPAANGVTGKNIVDAIKASPVHEKSPFHQEDLFQHLLLTANACQEYADERGWCDNEKDCGLDSKWVFSLCGFLHDLGKPGAYRPMRGEKLMAAGAKGHGLIGAAMLDSYILHSEEMKRVFELSDRDAVALALVTNYHMCRCPAAPNAIDSERLRFLANGLTRGAAHLLVALRYGDFHGKVPLMDFDYHAQQKYEEELLRMINSPPDILSDENRSKGVLITVTGRSGAGKTTRVRQLVEWVKEEFGAREGKEVVCINRDSIIERVVGSRERYNEDKKTYSPIVNGEIQSRVTSAIAGHRLCFLDTALMMNCRARKTVLADIHPSTLRIDLWVTRFPEETKEVAIGNGKTSMMDPVGSDVHWVDLESLMDSTSIKYLRETSNKNRAHFTIPVGHDRNLMMEGAVKPLLRNLLKNNRRMMEAPHPTSSPPRPPLLRESADMSLHRLVNYLVNSVGLEHTKRFFVSHAFCYNCQQVVDNTYVICVKYIDRRNRLWRLKWAREARGAAFLVRARDGGFETHDFKIVIPRWVEVLTKFHSDRGLKESQDMGDDFDCTFLEDSQQDVVKKFITKPKERFEIEGEEWHITEKIDGCLFVITVLSPDAALYELLTDVLINGTLSNIWHVVTSDGYVVIPATSGSIQVGDKMKSTLITAFLDMIPEKTSKTLKADDIWHEHLKEKFGETFVRLSKSLGKIDHFTAIVEAVCEDRKCFDDYVHHELTVSYNFNRAFLLGAFLNHDYYPVHKLSLTLTPLPFLHLPRSWKISTPQDALDALFRLDENVANTETDSSSAHPEGYVVTRWSTSNEKILASFKLKSPIYYKAHGVGVRYNEMFSKNKNKTLILRGNEETRDVLSKLTSVFPEEERINFIQRVLPSKVVRFIKHCYERVVDVYENLGDSPIPAEKSKNDPQSVAKFVLATGLHQPSGLYEMFVEHFHDEWNGICMNEDTVIPAVQTLLTTNRALNFNKIQNPVVKINKSFCDLFE